MSTEECSTGSFLQLTAAVAFLGYFLLFIRRYFSKSANRINVANAEVFALEREFAPNEVSAILSFKEYLLQLQDLAQKTSEEKVRFAESEKEDIFANDHALIQLGKRFTSVQEKLNEAIEYKQHRADDQFEQANKLINNLEREILAFRNSLEISLPPKTLIQERISRRFVVEKVTQTNEEVFSSKSKVGEVFALEMCNGDNVNQILIAIKDCMDTIVEESSSNWQTTAEEILKFLRGNHDDTKKYLENSIADYLEKSNHLHGLTSESVLSQTANIEKQLFDVFLFLEKQLVNAQAVAETLRFFNRKFVHFAQKCDKRWDDSCANYITTCNRVHEAQENLNFSSCKLSKMSSSLAQHTEELENLLKEFGIITQTVATIIATGDFQIHRKDQLETVCYSINDLENRVFKIEDAYGFNMKCILELIDKPGKKLESLLEYIEELGVLGDFVRGIAMSCEGMISSSSLNVPHAADGRMNRLPLFGESRDSESIQDEKDVFQDGDNIEKFSFGDASQTMAESQTSFIGGISHRRIIKMLNDAIRKTASERSKSKNTVAREKKSKEKWMQTLSRTESKMKHLNPWISAPSETALSEINSDCLIPKSSSSSSGED